MRVVTNFYEQSVCSLWRTTAIGAPFLWTDIFVTASDRYLARGFHAHIHRLKTFLERSKGVSLSLTMILDAPEDSTLQHVLDIIIPHIPFCRLLDIETPYNSLLMGSLLSFETSERLHTLYIKITDMPTEPITASFFHPMSVVRLKEVYLQGFIPQTPVTIVNDTLSRLVLRPGRHLWGPTIDFIRCSCDQLVELTFTPRFWVVPTIGSPVSLPSLRCLKIIDNLSFNICRYLSMPQLNTILLLEPEDYDIPRRGGDMPLLSICLQEVIIINRKSYEDPYSHQKLELFFSMHPSIKTFVCQGLETLRVISAFQKNLDDSDDNYGRQTKLLPLLDNLTLDCYCPVGDERRFIRELRNLLDNRRELQVKMVVDDSINTLKSFRDLERDVNASESLQEANARLSISVGTERFMLDTRGMLQLADHDWENNMLVENEDDLVDPEISLTG